MSGNSHVSRVRKLYKVILRLHRGLPDEMRTVGDAYVKEEFRRHKEADVEQTKLFMLAWTDYAMTLSKQLKQMPKKGLGILGEDMGESKMKLLSEDQIGQLYELFKETYGESNLDEPPGGNEEQRLGDSGIGNSNVGGNR